MYLKSIEGNWEDLLNKIGKKYPQLNEEDLKYVEGMEDCMLRMIEYKLRKTKQEMRDIIAEIGYSIPETYFYNQMARTPERFFAEALGRNRQTQESEMAEVLWY